MKKLFIIALATVLCAAFTVPASALENVFGGYWRTRAYNRIDINATETGSSSVVDTRTHLYYTAKFSDNFKFVNKAEFDNTWGDNNGGDVGADEVNIEVKNSYIDFNTGPMNFKIGTMGKTIARGFLFSADFSGLESTFKSGKNTYSALWVKVDEENITQARTGTATIGGDTYVTELAPATQEERDYYALTAALNISDTICIKPFLLLDKQEETKTSVYYLGTDVDVKMGETSIWTTLIIENGEIADVDTSAYLFALGVDAGIAHGQIFYATGDDSDPDNNGFSVEAGQSHYWAEILGMGTFDLAVDKTCNDKITNIMAVNAGATFSPMDKLKVSADIWYAQLAEDDTVTGETDLGVEIDLKATYKIVDNLNLDLVAAYLVAGDVYGTNAEDPIEIGTRISLSF